MGARHLVKAHSLAERMFLELRFGVLSARYLPGQIIPKGELGELYECRPAAVAEVLNALAFEGYLTRQSRSEFTVRTWGAEEVEDLFEMRANLEGHAAYRAAERATAAEISLLSALAAEAREPRAALAGAVDPDRGGPAAGAGRGVAGEPASAGPPAPAAAV